MTPAPAALAGGACELVTLGARAGARNRHRFGRVVTQARAALAGGACELVTLGRVPARATVTGSDGS